MQGHVIRLSEEGGEIRALEKDETIVFASDGCASSNTFARLTCKCEVSYAVCMGADGARAAKDVKLLPPGAACLCAHLPSVLQHVLLASGLVAVAGDTAMHLWIFRRCCMVHEEAQVMHSGSCTCRMIFERMCSYSLRILPAWLTSFCVVCRDNYGQGSAWHVLWPCGAHAIRVEQHGWRWPNQLQARWCLLHRDLWHARCA